MMLHLVKFFTEQVNILTLKTIIQLESGDFMIDLIILVLLILLAIYAHKKHATGEKLVTKPIRFFVFPVHWWLRDAIFKFTGSNLITGIIWLFVGSFTILLAFPLYFFNKNASLIFAAYLLIGYFFCLFPQNTALASDSDLGRAKYLSYSELKRGGLVTNTGLVLGQKQHHLVAKPSNFEGNVAIFGGAGTGKTAGNLIPTLLTFQGNALVIDIKPELLKKTGHLHPNKEVLNFINPKQSYDPLATLETYTDVTDLAKTLIPISSDIKEPYFRESAQNILASACWEFKGQKSFSEIAEFLTANPADAIIRQLTASQKSETRILINAVAGIKPEQLASVMNELRNTLVVFATDPVLKQLAGHRTNSIQPRNIESNWIYLVLPESKLKVYQPYLALIVAQFTRYLTQRPEKAQPNLLLALDEFPRLGYLPAFADAISTLRSRNVSVMILLQSLAQLDQLYQETGRKIIMDNMHYVVVHNALDHTSQQYFSDRAGTKTAVAKSHSYGTGGSGGTIDALFGSSSTSYNQQSAPLIRPEEFATLKQPILYAYQLGVTSVDNAYWFENNRMKALVASAD